MFMRPGFFFVVIDFFFFLGKERTISQKVIRYIFFPFSQRWLRQVECQGMPVSTGVLFAAACLVPRALSWALRLQ